MHVSNTNYYIICLSFSFSKQYIIWISNETDAVLLDDNGKIMTFNSKNELLSFVNKNSLRVNEDETTTYEINKFQQWVLEPKNNIEYVSFLNFWNLCTDISESVKMKFLGDEKEITRNIIYDKLFDGAGPFTVENPNPTFNDIEIIKLGEIIQDGLTLLIDNLSFNK